MLGLVRLWAGAYGHVCLVLAIAAAIGYPLTRHRLRGPAAPVLTLMVGLAALSVAICLLAWAHLFTVTTVVVLSAVAVSVSVWCLRRDVTSRTSLRRQVRPRGALVACFALLGAVLLALSVLALYPPRDDSTLYHLPLAQEFVRTHGLTYDPFVSLSMVPQANEAMFALTLLLGGGMVAPAALEFTVLALAALAIPLWFVGSGRWTGPGLFGACVLIASPVVISAGTQAYVDAWCLAFVLAGLLLALEGGEGRVRTRPALALAGLCFGEAAATKYTGLLFGLLIFAGALYAGRDRGVHRMAAAALAGFAVVVIPWFAWPLHVTGNPVYPLLTSLFGIPSGIWTAGEIHHQVVFVRSAGPSVGDVIRQDIRFLRGIGTNGSGGHRSELTWWLGAGYLGFLTRAAWHDRTFIGIAVSTLLCIVASFFFSADPRYLMPVLGPIAVLAALAANHLVASVYPRLAPQRRLLRVIPVAYLVIAAAVLRSGGGFARSYLASTGLPSGSTAKVTAYLRAHVPCYSAVTYLNQHAGGGYRAWDFGCEKATYFARGLLIGNAYSEGSWLRVLGSDTGATAVLREPAVLERRLQGLSVGWVVLPSADIGDPHAFTAEGQFRLVASMDGMDVFRVASG